MNDLKETRGRGAGPSSGRSSHVPLHTLAVATEISHGGFWHSWVS
jgi:hypothetical protein